MPEPEAVTELAQSLLDIQPFVVPKNAVILKDVTKGYRIRTSTFHVLKGLNLTVPQGTIYGLLGPSGCGKTTLLRCIVGRLSVNSGSVSVFGVPPDIYSSDSSKPKIGYMPQDFALNDELTVDETLKFYGRLTGMTGKQISEKSKFLVSFLNMSYHKKFCNKLSGGQKRRVSFAVALLHDPELLILDEPTVGVDPVLRQSIWDHLYTLVNTTNATVIITTHYIEEARMAHNVGLMLNGTLLAQSPPERLIHQHGCSTLEEVFLKLCLLKREPLEDPDENENENDTFKQDTQMTVAVNKNSVSKHELQPLTTGEDNHKESRVWIEMTDKKTGGVQQSDGNVVLENGKPDTNYCNNLLVVPNSNLNCSGIKSLTDTDMTAKVPVEISGYSRRCIEIPRCNRLAALFMKNMLFFVRHPGSVILEFFLPAAIMIIFALAVGKPLFGLKLGVVNHDTQDFGRLFLSSISNDTIVQVYYDDYDTAFQDAKEGLTWGVIYINANFTEAIISRFTHAGLAENDTLEQGAVSVSMDLSNQQVSLVINGELLFGFQRFSKSILERLGINPLIGTIPFKFESRQVYGTLTTAFNQFLLPAFILCVTFFMAMGLTALSLIIERQSGCLERMLVTGVQSIELILSQLMAQIIVMLVQIFLMLVVVFAIFRFTCEGSYLLASILAILQGLCGMSLGMVISSFCEEQTTAIVLSLAIFFISIMLDGILWPLEGMPYFMRYTSLFLPQTYAVEAMRSIMNRGWGLAYLTVSAGVLITIAWASVFIVIAWVVSRYFAR